ncbi:hypothetical protein HPP92_006307 [Vanilla planifolia]|uniref:Uncharacterized protein n=1 Tax=Vanilla planifolia TaxID=51239 RepID=A0A835V6N3_VANPL|nr:hypothetical protein HPP92_006307 [Vanilla planifolia]
MTFGPIWRWLMKFDETNEKKNLKKHPHLQAGGIMYSNDLRINGEKSVGAVPDIEVGDIFYFTAEMSLVGLHLPFVGGIDYKILPLEYEESIAVRVVAYGGYQNEDNDVNVLIYSVCVVNELDDERGSHFSYVTKVTYPGSMHTGTDLQGCMCDGVCNPGDAACSCAQRNGGFLPYLSNGLLVRRSPIIYECNANCWCDMNCQNRVTQKGAKLHLEIFRTQDCGWGVRSLDPIRAVIDDIKAVNKEGEEDEYIFQPLASSKTLKRNHGPEMIGGSGFVESQDVVKPLSIIISAKNSDPDPILRDLLPVSLWHLSDSYLGDGGSWPDQNQKLKGEKLWTWQQAKADRKAALDIASWMFNVLTSVGIIMVNKALMATHGFSFATTLTGLHFTATTIMTGVLRWLGYIQPSHLPMPELIKFVIFANLSIVGMNVSLMWNSVGFYQIAKLCMIPVSCFLEVLLNKVRYSRHTKLSIMVVLVGVAVCTVTDVSVNFRGLIAAAIAV